MQDTTRDDRLPQERAALLAQMIGHGCPFCRAPLRDAGTTDRGPVWDSPDCQHLNGACNARELLGYILDARENYGEQFPAQDLDASDMFAFAADTLGLWAHVTDDAGIDGRMHKYTAAVGIGDAMIDGHVSYSAGTGLPSPPQRDDILSSLAMDAGTVEPYRDDTGNIDPDAWIEWADEMGYFGETTRRTSQTVRDARDAFRTCAEWNALLHQHDAADIIRAMQDL